MTGSIEDVKNCGISQNESCSPNELLTYPARIVLTYPCINFGFTFHSRYILFINLGRKYDILEQGKENPYSHDK